ncbi:hypothetical protein KCP69_03280 [Salmonella enterica subsp. enterica]|nr:hypothetical protein KCP69_03280 [Salmonella enterica subsp. enterica]
MPAAEVVATGGCFGSFRTIGEWLPVAGRYTSAARRDVLAPPWTTGLVLKRATPAPRDRALLSM